MEILAITVPPMLLLTFVVGYLLTVFEPYWSWNTRRAIELKVHHAKDLKLQLMAQWWAAKLGNQEDDCYDESDSAVKILCTELQESLIRHRFITGDDPRVIQSKRSKILLRAQKRANWLKPVSTDSAMLINPVLVKTSDGQLIWRGEPAPYQSRFNDMYLQPV